jgi:hypothetical protein
MPDLKERTLVICIVDARGNYVDGAQAQVFINGVPKAQRHVRKGKPFSLQFSEGVESVEVRVSMGKFRSSEIVSTSIGTYTMTIPDEYLPQAAEPQPGPPGVAPQPGPADGGIPAWVKVLGIVVPAIVAIVTAYWQFVYKPNHEPMPLPPRVVQLGIFVMDNPTNKPVPNAHVTLVRPTRREDRPTDSLGTARFQISADDGKSLRVEVTAAAYGDGSREIDAPTTDASYYVFLTPETPPAGKNGKRAPTEEVVKPALLAGTWEVAVSGDVTNARLSKGTFDFVPQHDGSILCTTNFEADGMKITATGRASMRRYEVFLDFDASTSAGGSWKGKAELTLSSDHGHLTGRIQSKRGDDIPMTLHKL